MTLKTFKPCRGADDRMKSIATIRLNNVKQLKVNLVSKCICLKIIGHLVQFYNDEASQHLGQGLCDGLSDYIDVHYLEEGSSSVQRLASEIFF